MSEILLCRQSAAPISEADKAAANKRAAARERARYAANREAIAAQKAAYRIANLDRIRETQKAYHAKNREKRNAYLVAYRERNREALRAAALEKRRAKPSAGVRADDLTGQHFGRLTVVALAPRATGETRKWQCRCECGNDAKVLTASLRNWKTRSCGCLKRELDKAKLVTHSMSGTPTHTAWASMRARCEIPSSTGYCNYGARGISVCKRWKTFENFLSDMGERPPGLSLDRINNDGMYEPGNCRWADSRTQNQNRRNARWVSFGGETLSVAQWARKIGIGNASMSERLEKWPLERALTEQRRAR